MSLRPPEIEFNEALERLIDGNPKILPAGSVVSQNNVAKEAGRTPTALRKERYPELIKKIQNYVHSSKKLQSEKKAKSSKKSPLTRAQSKEERIITLEADSTNKVLSLLAEVSELRAHILKLNAREGTAKIIAFGKIDNR